MVKHGEVPFGRAIRWHPGDICMRLAPLVMAGGVGGPKTEAMESWGGNTSRGEEPADSPESANATTADRPTNAGRSI